MFQKVNKEGNLDFAYDDQEKSGDEKKRQSTLENKRNLSIKPQKIKEVKDEGNPNLGIGEGNIREVEGSVIEYCPEEECDEECVQEMPSEQIKKESKAKVLLSKVAIFLMKKSSTALYRSIHPIDTNICISFQILEEFQPQEYPIKKKK